MHARLNAAMPWRQSAKLAAAIAVEFAHNVMHLMQTVSACGSQ